MKKILTIILILITIKSYSQTSGDGSSCLNSEIFCTDIPSYVFAAGVNQSSLGSVGCLGSTPNPKWYAMQILSGGNINIKVWTTPPGNPSAAPSNDVDYIMWGPFDTKDGGCNSIVMAAGGPGSHGPSSGPCPSSFGGYPFGNIVDCSYAGDPIEYIHVQNAITNKWYILLVTNYSNQPCDIHLETQTQCSPGITNCALLFKPAKGDTVCEGEAAILKCDSISGCSYWWDGPNDFAYNSVSSTLNLTNTTTAMSGTYQVIVMSPSGRAASPQTTQLLVNPRPNLAPTTDTICLNEAAALTAHNAATYVWKSNNVVVGSAATINPSPTSTTQYQVHGTTSWGCKDSAQTQVVVAPKPTITVTPSVICSNDTARVNSNDIVKYLWSNNLTDSVIVPTATAITQLSVVGTNLAQCTDTAYLTINPNPIIVTTNDEICDGEIAIVSASGGSTYIWNNGATTPSISVSPTQNSVYSVISLSEFGCVGTGISNVVVNQKPVANFTPNPSLVYIDDAEITFSNSSINGYNYYWNFGEVGIDDFSTLENPSFLYTTVGYHTIKLNVESEFGCKDSIEKRIIVKSPYFYYFPSAFSPDKDGKNELFCPKGIGVTPKDYKMLIVNRWGEIMFQSTTPFECWDGKYKGQEALPGTYIYRVTLFDYDGISHEYQGQVVLIR